MSEWCYHSTKKFTRARNNSSSFKVVGNSASRILLTSRSSGFILSAYTEYPRNEIKDSGFLCDFDSVIVILLDKIPLEAFSSQTAQELCPIRVDHVSTEAFLWISNDFSIHCWKIVGEFLKAWGKRHT